MRGDNRANAKISTLEIYTDGSLKKYTNTLTFGGWSFIALRGGQLIYEVSGSEQGTTNQRMELIAIQKGLEYASSIREPSENVIIYSDSAYAINCYNQAWYENWRRNNWTNAKGEPVKNQDLWIEIIPYFENFWYHFAKVKGHDKNPWNNYCDLRAQAEAQELKDNWRGTDG